ncbi:MAG: hypothetical protein JO303_07450, partial [Caulobacteraceae bacterium]|nr:hypothetical protein [Caulobacteraceae bacterium]
PGRVSRRFGTWDETLRHWVAPAPGAASEEEVDVAACFDAPALGYWSVRCETGTVRLLVLRPLEIRPLLPPDEVRDTSNARLVWRSQIVAARPGTELRPPAVSPWHGLVEQMEAFLHGEQAPIEVRRLALGSEADLQIRGQESGLRRRFRFSRDGKPVALGFAIVVDGLRFRLAIPPALWASGDGATWRALRTARFFDLAASDEALPEVPNPFARRWLATILFAALGHEALTTGCDVEAANRAIAEGRAGISPADVLATLFQSPFVTDAAAEGGATDRLRQDLHRLLQDRTVLAGLGRMARVLWEPVDASWEPWLRDRFKGTVAAAIREAISSLCPDIDEDALLVDIDAGPLEEDDAAADDASIWITEATPGGTGLIEAFLRAYAEDPRRFYALLSAALQPGEYELTDHQLCRFLDLVAGDHSVAALAEAAQAFRMPESLDGSGAALAHLRRELSRHGFVLFHGFLAALGNRVLRPGATAEADAFLRDLVDGWRREEERLGVELDPSVVAYCPSQNDAIDRVLGAAGMAPPVDDLRAWRFNTIYGLLWPRGATARRTALGLYNPFVELPEAERLLVAGHLAQPGLHVALDVEGWRQAALQALAAGGTVTLVCPVAPAGLLADALTFFATNPVQSDYLVVYARIESLRRVDERYEANLEIAEAGQ